CGARPADSALTLLRYSAAIGVRQGAEAGRRQGWPPKQPGWLASQEASCCSVCWVSRRRVGASTCVTAVVLMLPAEAPSAAAAEADPALELAVLTESTDFRNSRIAC